ncbi:hypothetical protein [Sphingomonas sp. CFBP 13706]|uniref:hypothetical protein n=1 Tax=Sphingomonas sp. CFBP 13706 TaxID=2775314 RepID=UPI00177E8004|nr:hypothetical protein [Sphingomonas sp. CFBP 13706]MBD8736238.1 hypothetical protein [Sphingomonas sp. CFBP 13706]
MEEQDLQPAEVDALLESVWPRGVPAEERAILTSLPSDRRRKIIKRLNAMHQASSPDADLPAIIQAGGMGRSTFFALQKRWNHERSVKALLPFATRPPRRKPLPSMGTPQPGNGDDRSDAASAVLSLPAMRLRERERMRAEAAQPAVLLQRFGHEFVLDVSAVDMIVQDERGPRWRICAFLIERASGLILSAGAAGSNEAPPMRTVAREGHRTAAELRIAVRDPSLTVVMPEPHGHEAVPWLQSHKRLGDVLGRDRVLFEGPRRFGTALLESVGEKVGALGLRPRATPRTVPTRKQTSETPAPSSDDMEILLEVQVARHNEPIVRRLRSLGLIGGKGDPQPLLELLDAAYPP